MSPKQTCRHCSFRFGTTEGWTGGYNCPKCQTLNPNYAAEASARTEGAGETCNDLVNYRRPFAYQCVNCGPVDEAFPQGENRCQKCRIEARRDKSGDVDPGNCPKCGATAPRALVGRGYSCSNQACVWVGTESQRVHPDEHPVLAGYRVERERVRGLPPDTGFTTSFALTGGTGVVSDLFGDGTIQPLCSAQPEDITTVLPDDEHYTLNVARHGGELVARIQIRNGIVRVDSLGETRTSDIKRKLKERSPKVHGEKDCVEDWEGDWK